MSTKVLKIVRSFHFDSRRTYELSFSDRDKIRLNDDTKSDPFVALKAQGGGVFTTDLDATAQTRTINPGRLVRWTGFEGIQEEPENTSVRYRCVINGGTDHYWDGSNWTQATMNDHWSTFQDINSNISTLPITSRDLSVKMNLRTTDGKSTPEVRSVKLLGEFRINWLNDLTLDTVLPKLREKLRSTTVIAIQIDQQTDIIDLNGAYKLDNVGYNFLDVIAVYNSTTDPERLINIASGYAPGVMTNSGKNEPGQIQLSAQQNSGDILFIEMEILPTVARSTDLQFTEESELPALLIENVVELKSRDGTRQELNLGHQGEYIKDHVSLTATQTTPPKQLVLRFDFRIIANNEDDLLSIIDALSSWIIENKIIRTYGLDVAVVLDPVQDVNVLKKIDLDDVKEAIGSFQIQGVPFFLEPSKEHYLIEDLNINILNT